MSARVRAPIPQLSSGEQTLGGGVGHYLARVLRLRAGDAFVAFDPASGREADGRVLGVDGDSVTADIGALREGAAMPPRAITLVQGLAKGDKVDAVVRDATELGATRIIVAATARSVVKLGAERASSRVARWTRIAREAARQCGRSAAPTIDEPCAWSEALARVDPSAARFCLWERATEPLGGPLMRALASGAPLAFAVGPEGGLDDAEALEAKSQGWQLVSLGKLVLRTETVAASVLGAVVVLGAG